MKDRSWNQPPDAGSRFAERRSVPRFAFSAAVVLTDPFTKTDISGRITEISQKGCLAEVHNPLPPNSVVQLRVEPDERSFHTWARVIYDRPGFGLGLLFIGTAPDQSNLLASWLDELT